MDGLFPTIFQGKRSELREKYGLELINLHLVSELVMIRCALARKESHGLHYTLDYQQTRKVAEDTFLRGDRA